MKLSKTWRATLEVSKYVDIHMDDNIWYICSVKKVIKDDTAQGGVLSTSQVGNFYSYIHIHTHTYTYIP